MSVNRAPSHRSIVILVNANIQMSNCENAITQKSSVVMCEDCMGKNPESDVKKFLILRPNCKLYSQWDSSTSLVF